MSPEGQFRRELGHVGQLRAETGLAGWRVTFRGGRVVTSPARVGAHSVSFDNGALVLRFLPLSIRQFGSQLPRICVALGD